MLRDEIIQQPSVIDELLTKELDHIHRIATELRQREIYYMVIAARGTSDNAARYGKYLFGSRIGMQVALATPSLYTLYDRPPRLHGALVVGISQSGESEDVVSVLAEAHQQTLPTLAITNSPDSPLAAEADYAVDPPQLRGLRQERIVHQLRPGRQHRGFRQGRRCHAPARRRLRGCKKTNSQVWGL